MAQMAPAGERHVKEGVRFGIVKKLIASKEFGWILDEKQSELGGKHLYFALSDATASPLSVGSRVRYRLYNDDKGVGACEVETAAKEPSKDSDEGFFLVSETDGAESKGATLQWLDTKAESSAESATIKPTLVDDASQFVAAPKAVPAPRLARLAEKDALHKQGRTLLDDGQAWFGTVEMWQQSKRFGWVLPDDAVDARKVPAAKLNQGKVFVHGTDMAGILGTVMPGTRVCYKLYYDAKGLGAYDVRAVIPRDGLRLSQKLQFFMKYLSSPKDVALCIRLPKEAVGFLIGKNGDHVKKAQSSTRTTWHFDDWTGPEVEDDFPPIMADQGWWRKNRRHSILTVVGGSAAVTNATVLVAGKMAELVMSRLHMVPLLVPQAVVGRLVGKKGANIKRLQGDTKENRVRVGDKFEFKHGGTTEDMVTVTLCGPEESFVNALAQMVGTVAAHYAELVDRSAQVWNMSSQWR